MLSEISTSELFFSFLLLSFLLSFFCFCLYASIFRFTWKKAFTVIIIIYIVCLFHIWLSCHLLYSCSERKVCFSLIIRLEAKHLIPIVDVTHDHWIMINTWLICILYIVLFFFINMLLSACTTFICVHCIVCTALFCVHQHPAYCMHQLLSFSAFSLNCSFTLAVSLCFCLHYHLVPTVCLLFYHLLLPHPEFLYLTCLTMLGHFLALPNTYIAFVFLYA